MSVSFFVRLAAEVRRPGCGSFPGSQASGAWLPRSCTGIVRPGRDRPLRVVQPLLRRREQPLRGRARPWATTAPSSRRRGAGRSRASSAPGSASVMPGRPANRPRPPAHWPAGYVRVRARKCNACPRTRPCTRAPRSGRGRAGRRRTCTARRSLRPGGASPCGHRACKRRRPRTGRRSPPVRVGTRRRTPPPAATGAWARRVRVTAAQHGVPDAVPSGPGSGAWIVCARGAPRRNPPPPERRPGSAVVAAPPSRGRSEVRPRDGTAPATARPPASAGRSPGAPPARSRILPRKDRRAAASRSRAVEAGVRTTPGMSDHPGAGGGAPPRSIAHPACRPAARSSSAVTSASSSRRKSS